MMAPRFPGSLWDLDEIINLTCLESCLLHGARQWTVLVWPSPSLSVPTSKSSVSHFFYSNSQFFLVVLLFCIYFCLPFPPGLTLLGTVNTVVHLHTEAVGLECKTGGKSYPDAVGSARQWKKWDGQSQQSPQLQGPKCHKGKGAGTYFLVQQWQRDWVFLNFINQGNARSVAEAMLKVTQWYSHLKKGKFQMHSPISKMSLKYANYPTNKTNKRDLELTLVHKLPFPELY